jgi:hypothetical protein
MELILEFLEVTGRALTFVGFGFFAFAFLSGSGLNQQSAAAAIGGVFGLGLWMGARWLRARATPRIG